jgi:hypothetical protein
MVRTYAKAPGLPLNKRSPGAGLFFVITLVGVILAALRVQAQKNPPRMSVTETGALFA